MKELKRFFRKNKSKILLAVTVTLMVAVIGMSLLYLIAESISPSLIFFAAAALMVDLALNFFLQKKKNKGVLFFYGIAAAACIAIGCVLRFMPVVE